MRPAAKKSVRIIRPWLSLIARIGFAAKGTIYLMIGLLALAFVLGFTPEVEDQRGAIEVLARQPFGAVLLLLLAFGLLNYGVWNAVQCGWDPERVGGDWIGNALRVIFGFSAVLNLFLAWKTVGVGLGRGWNGASGDDTVQSWTQRLLSWPGGRALVILAAAVMAGIALSLLVRMVRGRYMEQFSDRDLATTGNRVVKAFAWCGFLARALITALIAGFLWRAGLASEPEEAGGFVKALATLPQHPFGRTLLALTGAGVMAQGVYIWLMVPYRVIRVKKAPDDWKVRWGRAWGS